LLTAQPFDPADSPRELHHTQSPGKQQSSLLQDSCQLRKVHEIIPTHPKAILQLTLCCDTTDRHYRDKRRHEKGKAHKNEEWSLHKNQRTYL
jgi:hypothetical protein